MKTIIHSGVFIINSLTRKALAATAITATLTGCDLGQVNLSIEVQGNGSVISDDERINCPTVACSFDYQDTVNAEVTLSATPGPGYEFGGFDENSTCINSDSFETATCVILTNTSKTVVAKFTTPHGVLAGFRPNVRHIPTGITRSGL